MHTVHGRPARDLANNPGTTSRVKQQKTNQAKVGKQFVNFKQGV